jgi:hypothetical protein
MLQIEVLAKVNYKILVRNSGLNVSKILLKMTNMSLIIFHDFISIAMCNKFATKHYWKKLERK